jgi:hypothetical protein
METRSGINFDTDMDCKHNLTLILIILMHVSCIFIVFITTIVIKTKTQLHAVYIALFQFNNKVTAKAQNFT